MRILITGGTGYFGRHMTKRLLGEGHVVCIYSRDEWKQAQIPAHDNLRKFIGCVRDRSRLRRAMDGCDLVIHAAALKRIDTAVYNPSEVVRTNVLGTMNVIEAAQDAMVDRVVLLSSDKAWQPVSIYGQSKALAEGLMVAADNTVNHERGPRFICTRYGNVIGSTGSVVPIWRELVRRGERVVPCSDPAVTRFWMSIGEAMDLVWKAATEGKGGEILIPTLPAFSLGNFALAMDVEIEITGLAAFEKTHEGMADGNTSDLARQMSVHEIVERLKEVE